MKINTTAKAFQPFNLTIETEEEKETLLNILTGLPDMTDENLREQELASEIIALIVNFN